MISHPYSSSHMASQNSYTSNSVLAQQINQNQIGAKELAELAKVSRAKRLDSLLRQLQDLIQVAVTSPDPATAAQDQADILEFVLDRLNGTDTEPPDSLGQFAYEMESLIDDVLEAWDALLAAEGLAEEIESPEHFKSIDGVLAMLNHIANKRVASLLASHLYQQWRHLYRDFADGNVMDFSPEDKNTIHLPPSIDKASAEGMSSKEPYALFQLLKHAVDMTDAQGIFLISEPKRAALQDFFASLPPELK